MNELKKQEGVESDKRQRSVDQPEERKGRIVIGAAILGRYLDSQGVEIVSRKQDAEHYENCKSSSTGRLQVAKEDGEGVKDESHDQTANDVLEDVTPQGFILDPAQQHGPTLPASAVTELYFCRPCGSAGTGKTCTNCNEPTKYIGWIETTNETIERYT